MSNCDYANQLPTESWRSAMTIPRELKLVDNDGNLHLVSQPVKELEKLRENAVQIDESKLSLQNKIEPIPISNGIAEIELDIDFNTNSSSHVVIEFSNELEERLFVGIDQILNAWYIDRRYSGENTFSDNFAQKFESAPILKKATKQHLRIFLDVASIEIFANDGLTIMTEVFFPSTPMQQMHIKTIKGEATVSGKIYSLKSANFASSSNAK
jgi:fructan beta-fructosidase